MKRKIIDFLAAFFDFWDTSCNICRSEHNIKNGLCTECLRKLPLINGNRCEICLDLINTKGLCKHCLEQKPDYKSLFCKYSYEDNIKSLIHKFKFGNARYLAKVLVPLMDLESIAKLDFDVIVPVPLSVSRFKERGYNQTEELALVLSRVVNKPVRDILIKQDRPEHMAQLNKKERFKQIKGLYSFKEKLHGENVLLIDDVCTTGATLTYCASQLKKAGSGEIYCACVARTDVKK